MNTASITKQIIRIVEKALLYCPLTGRGLFSIILASIAFFYYGLKESDLVASIIAVCLFVPICISACIIVSSSKRVYNIFKEMHVYANSPTNGESRYARQSTLIPLIIPRLKIAPLCNLKIKRNFTNSLIRSKSIVIRGMEAASDNSSNARSIVTDYIEFPHRGIHSTRGLILTYSDVFGLCSIKKHIPFQESFRILPQEKHITHLPIMAASAQLGDIDHATVERTGDLFDIRAYQSGDSLKRVLWKVYAKSGNLIVRQPEPAIIPEGEVAVFCVARAQHDSTAAAFLSYLQILDQQNINYISSCLGAAEELAKTQSDATELLLQSAYLSDDDIGDSFSSFIETVRKYNPSLHKIICFIPSDFHTAWNSEKDILLLQSIRRTIATHSISLILALAPENTDSPMTVIPNETNSRLHTLDKKINTTVRSCISGIRLGILKPFLGSASSRMRHTRNSETFNDQEKIEVGISHV